ncbi:MAG: DUF692 domain-containing protein, partial [Bdellovibrionales bacterium]|nr:DUF692 domain-containing protein [Bdellovibrionales bacterium]
MNPLFKNYGIGVGLRPTHYSEFIGRKPTSVDWVEVITENFLPWGDITASNNLKSYRNLLKIRHEVPVALHGVSLNLGSVDELNYEYLIKLKKLKQTVNPIWVSDHLTWTGVHGQNLHDLLPLPYTEEVIDHVTNKIMKVQDFLGDRLIIENVSSYIEYQTSEISEMEFIAEVCKRSGCGILLDINNIYVSSVNHNFNAHSYIDHMPKNQIAQIHLAGHIKKSNHLIDTHSTPVCDEVWSLYKYTIDKIGRV